jgi:hypothetical protein
MIEYLDKRATIPDSVILRAVGEEAVLLNLNTNQYYSLNPVGLRMLEILTQSATSGQALATLLEEYAVEPAELESDLHELQEQLLSQGLIELV